MPRFFIEVPHGADEASCLRAIRVFMETGSHFLINADWGCKDSIHKAWFTADADSKEQARNIVPHAYRRDAQVTELVRFNMDDVKGMMKQHGKA